jgi:hypothetical protein
VAAVNREEQVRELFERDRGARLITTSKKLAKLQPSLPADVTVLSQQPRFLRREEVLVLGRPQLSASRGSDATRGNSR